MENASKALLIATAILIIVLIITFGIRVFNSSKDTTGEVDQVATIIKSKSDAARGKIGLASILSNNNNNPNTNPVDPVDPVDPIDPITRADTILNSTNLDDTNECITYLETNFPKDRYYSAYEIRVICHLIMQRSKRLFGEIYDVREIHVTSRYLGCKWN